MRAEIFWDKRHKMDRELARAFSTLIRIKGSFDLLPELDDIEDPEERSELIEDNLFEIIEVRNGFTGEVRDAYLKGADAAGIYVIGIENHECKLIRFDDISNMFCKIAVIDALEQQLDLVRVGDVVRIPGSNEDYLVETLYTGYEHGSEDFPVLNAELSRLNSKGEPYKEKSRHETVVSIHGDYELLVEIIKRKDNE